jgi:hypothetical protein
MFVLLHSVLQLDTIGVESVAWWSMMIVVLSGFLGRYLYTQVPEMSQGVELEELDHERTFQTYRARMPRAMEEIDRELGDARERATRVARRQSVLGALVWLFWQDFGRMFRTMARRSRLGSLGVERKPRKDLARRAARVIVITRRQVVAPKAQLLLHSWKKVHVPFTVILTVFAALHIWMAWSLANW